MSFFHAFKFLFMKNTEEMRVSYAVLTVKLFLLICTCNCCRCMHSIQVLPQHLVQYLSLQQEECQQVLSLAQAHCVCSSISHHTIMFKQAQGECLDELCLVLVVISIYLEWSMTMLQEPGKCVL